MSHIYLLFDFAKDEEKAQQARHKLESWKQAFRLDKKLLYKVERTPPTPTDGDTKQAKAEKPEKTERSESKKGKTKSAAKGAAKEEAPPPAPQEDIKLLVRLAFSGHEKLSEQRWVQRIPMEDPFHGASPKVVKSGEAGFEATEKQFDDLV